MTRPTFPQIVRALRQSARPKPGGSESDQERLTRFVRYGDGTAFRALVS
ncbi:hypothetical protein [Gemmata massiliana]|nr:hypothetical protein [Gemmata massiliana]